MKTLKLYMIALLPALFACSKDSITEDPVTDYSEKNLEADFTEIAFPEKTGDWSDVYLFGQKLPVEEIDGKFVYQGDIFLPESKISRSPQNLILEAGEEPDPLKSTGRTKFLWPDNTVYYQIDSSLPNQDRVYNAIQHWETNTAVRFIERTDESNYVYFTPGSGCSSYVGMVGGKQYINLADACSTGNTIHEIGHTLGLWHEQSRADRDEVITIQYDNIVSGREYNFYTYQESGWDGAEYSANLDLGSIMMYSSYSFSANGLPTITKKDGSTFRAQRSALSSADISGVNVLYPGTTTTETQTSPETDTGSTDTGSTDTGTTDTGSSGSTDGGSTTTGSTETGSTDNGSTETSTETGSTTEPTTTPTQTNYENGQTYVIEGVSVLRKDDKWWVYKGKGWREVELINGRWRFVK